MKRKINLLFEKFSSRITKAAGKPLAFILAMMVIAAWIITGPVFHFSNSWQLAINTSTTIITFLMVFIIQQTQNKEAVALQLKLNELIAATSTASNRLIDVEDISAEELETLKKFYVKLAELTKKEADIHMTHSIDEAIISHQKTKRNKS